MKEDFIRNYWMHIVLLIVFIIASIMSREVLMIVLTVVIAISMVGIYRKYDPEERKLNEWWLSLSKEERIRAYNSKEEIKTDEKQ